MSFEQYSYHLYILLIWNILERSRPFQEIFEKKAKNFLPTQYLTFSNCCQELLQESEVNSDNYFDRIVTGDETPGYTFMIPSVKKKADEETPIRLHRTRPLEKIIIVIFLEKSGILLSEYLPRGTTISGPFYASIIERLRCAILEKGGGKVVLLFHDNAPDH